MRDAARSLGLQLHVLDASTEGEIDAAFGTLIELRARFAQAYGCRSAR
jgi:hypothetical protein